MVEADLMKSAFDGLIFEALIYESPTEPSNFRNCRFEGADLRGIRGKYAIWQGSDSVERHDGRRVEKSTGEKMAQTVRVIIPLLRLPPAEPAPMPFEPAD